MEFVSAADHGVAPEIHVTGLKSIHRISKGIVRITFYAEFEHDGAIERRVVLHLVRDYEQWLMEQSLYPQAAAEIAARPPPCRDKITSDEKSCH